MVCFDYNGGRPLCVRLFLHTDTVVHSMKFISQGQHAYMRTEKPETAQKQSGINAHTYRLLIIELLIVKAETNYLKRFKMIFLSFLQSAALGGAAHLVNFCSTDTVAGLLMAQRYYGCPMAGFSIPAAEHRYNKAHTLTYRYINHGLGCANMCTHN